MRVLLDTRIAIWAVAADPRLPARATQLMLAADAVFVSAASVWEISIKHAISPARMSMSGSDALAEFQAAGFNLLPITAEHAAAVDGLPALHQDPFDRILIAQALTEPLKLITADSALEQYTELVLRV
jgi:PIN domain nuclease of toxin-antitoxin system